MKRFIIYLISCLFIFSSLASKSQKVEFLSNEKEKKVEVFVDGKFFTAFIYPDIMEKQSLYPILSASGITITRGYPINPRPFERTDHPHHVGLWFNFGSVNGLHFWNNSFAIKPEDKVNYGSIKYKKIISLNEKTGELVVGADWVDSNNNVLLNEETTYTFSGLDSLRIITRKTKLTAAQEVIFNENKEGLLGLRVDRAFEEPATKPEVFLDSKGIETKVPSLNNDGVNGVYRNAIGNSGAEVWGKRSAWVALKAKKDNEIITIVILDHPENLNYPAWSHARGYGLFATNNFGGRVFDKNTDEVKLTLKQGKSIVFIHQVIVGGNLNDEEINRFSKELK